MTRPSSFGRYREGWTPVSLLGTRCSYRTSRSVPAFAETTNTNEADSVQLRRPGADWDPSCWSVACRTNLGPGLRRGDELKERA